MPHRVLLQRKLTEGVGWIVKYRADEFGGRLDLDLSSVSLFLQNQLILHVLLEMLLDKDK